MQVREIEDDTAILRVLEPDRVWAAYALCDMEPALRRHARFIGARRDGQTVGIVLVMSLPDLTVLLPCGEHEGVAAILSDAESLPNPAFLNVRPADLATIERRYTLVNIWPMRRMVVTPVEFRQTRSINAELVALTHEHLPILQELFAERPDTVFTPSMLGDGAYVGAFIDGALVSVAGTHAVSLTHHVGAIGNVYTRPEYRGRGLAQATTAAVVGQLFESGITEAVLNVASRNVAAIAAYHRLGFREHTTFWEGRATLRSTRG